MFMRKVIVGSGSLLLAATPVVNAGAAPASPKPEETKGSAGAPLCRPSELPIYPTPTATVAKLELDEPSELEKTLLEPVRIVRTSLVSAVHQVQSVSSQVGTAVNDTTDQFSFIISYLREEDNEAQRVGATAMGTLTGFIFGLRGGLIKKITYSLLGTAGMGSICYPEEAKEYLNQSIVQGKLLAHVGYNFVMGVKPGDPEAVEFLPNFKIPTSLDEISALIRSTRKKSAQGEHKEETKQD